MIIINLIILAFVFGCSDSNSHDSTVSSSRGEKQGDEIRAGDKELLKEGNVESIEGNQNTVAVNRRKCVTILSQTFTRRASFHCAILCAPNGEVTVAGLADGTLYKCAEGGESFSVSSCHTGTYVKYPSTCNN